MCYTYVDVDNGKEKFKQEIKKRDMQCMQLLMQGNQLLQNFCRSVAENAAVEGKRGSCNKRFAIWIGLDWIGLDWSISYRVTYGSIYLFCVHTMNQMITKFGLNGGGSI